MSDSEPHADARELRHALAQAVAEVYCGDSLVSRNRTMPSLIADALLASEQFTIGLRAHEEHEMEPLRGAPDTGERSERTGLVTRPGLLAVDADGYVWRCYDDGWSMAPTNPDNSPIPRPVTYYEPVE